MFPGYMVFIRIFQTDKFIQIPFIRRPEPPDCSFSMRQTLPYPVFRPADYLYRWNGDGSFIHPPQK